MIYEKAYDNLQLTISTARSVKKEQLIRFFRNVCPKSQMERYLRSLITQRIVEYDAKTDIITWHGSVPVNAEELRYRRLAFWIIAAIGCENIREFVVRSGFSQFLFITNSNDVYDITVVKDKPSAMVARIDWNRSLVCDGNPDGTNGDLVTHIALISDDANVEKLGLDTYGFDSYCRLDSENNPIYTELG